MSSPEKGTTTQSAQSKFEQLVSISSRVAQAADAVRSVADRIHGAAEEGDVSGAIQPPSASYGDMIADINRGLFTLEAEIVRLNNDL